VVKYSSAGFISISKITIIIPSSISLRETGFAVRPGLMAKARKCTVKTLPCVFVGVHDKEHTVEFCTVNSHCRALRLTMHGELCLSCVTGRRAAKKSNWRRRGQTARYGLCRAPAEKRTAIPSLYRASWSKTHDNHLPLPCTMVLNAR
jgi:hypothetical protein